MMPSEDTEILECNQYHKTDKAPFIIYADLESLIEKIDDCKIALKIYLQQKQVNIFHQVFPCLQYRHLKAYIYIYTYIYIMLIFYTFK